MDPHPEKKKAGDAAGDEEHLEPEAQVQETILPASRACLAAGGVFLVAIPIAVYLFRGHRVGSFSNCMIMGPAMVVRAVWSDQEHGRLPFSWIVGVLALVVLAVAGVVLGAPYDLDAPFLLVVGGLAFAWSQAFQAGIFAGGASEDRPAWRWSRRFFVVATPVMLLYAAAFGNYRLDLLRPARAYDAARFGAPEARDPAEVRELPLGLTMAWVPPAEGAPGFWCATEDVGPGVLGFLPLRSRHWSGWMELDGGTYVDQEKSRDTARRLDALARAQGQVPEGWDVRPPASAEWTRAREAGRIVPRYGQFGNRGYWVLEPEPGRVWPPRQYSDLSVFQDGRPVEVERKASAPTSTCQLRLVMAPRPGE